MGGDRVSTSGGVLAGTAPGLSRQFRSGLFYTFDQSGTDSTTAPPVGTLFCALFSVGRSTSFNNAALEVTAGVATAQCALGIYADTGGLSPGALLANFGTIDASVVGVATVPVNLTLGQGAYWLAVLPLTAASTYRSRPRLDESLLGSLVAGTSNAGTCYSAAGQAALPANAGTAGAVVSQFGEIPKLQLQAA